MLQLKTQILSRNAKLPEALAFWLEILLRGGDPS